MPPEPPWRVSEAVALGTALASATRLPVGGYCSSDPDARSRATRWLPLVGLLVGTLLALVWLLAQSVAPSSIASVTVLLAGALLGGARREDALVGVCDRDAKRRFARDGRVGSRGALALALLVLARFAIVWELSVMPTVTPVAALLAAHVLALWSSVWSMSPVPRARGVGRRRPLEASLVALIALSPALALGGLPVLLFPPLALVVTVLAGRVFRQRSGVPSDDRPGAVSVLVEVAVLLAALLAALP